MLRDWSSLWEKPCVQTAGGPNERVSGLSGVGVGDSTPGRSDSSPVH